MKKDKTKIEGSRNDKPSLEDLARQAAVDDRDLIHKIVGVPKPKLKPTPRSKQDIDSDINAQPTPISTILTESGRRKHIPVVYLSDVDLDELYEQAGDGGVFANPDFYSKVDTEERIVFHTEPDSTDRCFLFCSSNAVKQPIAILKAPSSSMAWVPDKGLFISCDNNYIYNWNPSSGKVKIFEHELIQPSLEYAPDLGLLVSSEGTVIRYIDPQGNLDKKEITSTKLDIHSMKWVPHLGLFVL
ncbi:hypothetical protein HN814_10810, partial [Candidatus Woesearchaeota archaeon]|nr:hypothetical protein [Candidatus Woesearchaeota archaeon]